MFIRSFAIAGCLAALGLFGVSASAQGAEELRCRSMLDGQVAWNQNGDNAWQPENIEALCAGTTDADARISCFEAGIREHDDWSRAISECVTDDVPRAQTPDAPPTAPPAEDRQPEPEDAQTALCKSMIQGNIPMSMPNGSRNWDEARLDRLCNGTVNAMETLKCFIEALGNSGGTPRTTDTAIDICRTR